MRKAALLLPFFLSAQEPEPRASSDVTPQNQKGRECVTDSQLAYDPFLDYQTKTGNKLIYCQSAFAQRIHAVEELANWL